MATYHGYGVAGTGFSKSLTGAPTAGQGAVYRACARLDFAAIKAARAVAGAAALLANDVIGALDIPIGRAVLQAGIKIVTPESVAPTATFSLGGVASVAATYYVNAAASNSAANTVFGVGGLAVAMVTTAVGNDTLDLTIGTAVPQNAVVDVWAIVANCA